MNRTQAQFILGACPPGPLPADNAEVAAALALAQTDAELAHWLAATRAFDAAVGAKLRAVAPPADLRDAILAGRHAASPASPTSRRFWQRPGLLALAAVLVALLSLAAFWLGGEPRPDAAAFRRDAAKFLSEEWQHDLDYPESSFPKIQQWAAAQTKQERFEAPAELAGNRTYGCKVFRWRGHTATLVCFTSKEEGGTIHIVSVDRAALPEAGQSAPGGTPQFARAGEWNTAAWSQGPRFYVALTTANTETLARHVRPVRSAVL